MYGGGSFMSGFCDYLVGDSIEEGVGLLDQHGEDAKILAGGQSLIPLIRFRLARPSVLVDINRVPGLEYVQEADGILHIGTMTREAELDSSSLIRDRYPILNDTSTMVADPVVRNWATVGGNLAHADPANDHPATMLALGARIVAVGPAGERELPIEGFFTDIPFETALHSNEMLKEIRVPAPVQGSGGGYFKVRGEKGGCSHPLVGGFFYKGWLGECSFSWLCPA